MLWFTPCFFDEVVPFPNFLLACSAFTQAAPAGFVVGFVFDLRFFPVHFFPFVQQLSHPRFAMFFQRLRLQGEKTRQI